MNASKFQISTANIIRFDIYGSKPSTVSFMFYAIFLLFLLRGLLGAHVMADLLRQRGERMLWYKDELLHMANELGHRLLPAFNTTSGLPYPKVLIITVCILDVRTDRADCEIPVHFMGTNIFQAESSDKKIFFLFWFSR